MAVLWQILPRIARFACSGQPEGAGVCAGKESPAEHDERLLKVLESLRIRRWPWPGPVAMTFQSYCFRNGSKLAVISTGDELVPPGQAIRPGQVYDSNAAILCAAIEEQGGRPVPLGICPDRLDQWRPVERAVADRRGCRLLHEGRPGRAVLEPAVIAVRVGDGDHMTS